MRFTWKVGYPRGDSMGQRGKEIKAVSLMSNGTKDVMYMVEVPVHAAVHLLLIYIHLFSEGESTLD